MAIKVFEIIPELSTGGAEQVVISYLEKLKDDADISVRAVAFFRNKGRLWEKHAEETGLAVDYLGLPDEANALEIIGELRRYFKKNKPDVIHAHMQFVKKICVASALLPIRKYQTIHSDVSRIYSNKEAVIERLYKKAAGFKTICLTDKMAREADRLFGERSLVLRNGIDLKKYKTGVRNEYRRKFGFDENNFVIGHVGRFHEVKNHELLVKAFSEISRTDNTARLVLVGAGELKEKTEDLCRTLGCLENVLFPGERNDVPELLQMMDLFVFPSRFEGFPVSLLEAQAAGLPCLVSDRITEEVLVSNRIKRLSPECGESEWAKGALEYRTFCYAPKYSLDDYSIDTITEELKSIYLGQDQKNRK